MSHFGTNLQQPSPFQGIRNNSIARQPRLQYFDLKLEEANMGIPPGRPGLLEQQEECGQPSRQHRLRLLCDRYKFSICSSPTFWTTARNAPKTPRARADLGMSISTADPQEGPCRGLAVRHRLSVYVAKG